MLQIAILGYGVVGSGVAEVIRKNTAKMEKRAGKRLVVKKILDIRDIPDGPDSDVLTKCADDVFMDPEITVVVETIGGIGIAYEFTKRALYAGKSVVTSNKELVAEYGPELMQLAYEHNAMYLFEAAVGGGIPIIRPLFHCLSANEINGISGILNGTTNYILTQMTQAGLDFETALRQAQELGYAEQDPRADIEGHDAGRKLAILSSIAYNEFVDYRNIHVEGISSVSVFDMMCAAQLKATVKLVCHSERLEGGILARVSPMMLSIGHPLAFVEDVFNAIVVNGDALGDAMFYGRGAGRMPTASAVVADIIDIARHIALPIRHLWERHHQQNIVDYLDGETQLFVRMKGTTSDEIINCIGQVHFLKTDNTDELVFVTMKAQEKILRAGTDSLVSKGAILLSLMRADLPDFTS